MTAYSGTLHRVQYYETDQMGIVHHSNYIRWFEEARTDLLETLGLSYARMEEMGAISPVLSVSCEYKQPVRYGETVRILPRVTGYNGVRMEVTYRVEDAATGALRAQGKSSHCFLDARTGIPARLKKTHPEIDALLSAALEK